MESVAKGDGQPSSIGTGLNGAVRCGQSVRVDNAGLVLLSPYLPALFDRTGVLAASAAQLQVRDIPKALRLLTYLAYGEAKPSDQGLELNRVLCGVSFPQPAETSLALEKRDLGLCDDLMAAALLNWKSRAIFDHPARNISATAWRTHTGGEWLPLDGRTQGSGRASRDRAVELY